MRHVKRDVTEEHAEAHQGKGRREPHHDYDHDEAEHQKPECGIAHVCRSPPMPRWRATSSIDLASSMTSISATSLRRLGHSPVLRQITQRTISAMPWIMTSTPATGIMNLNCQTGGPSAVTVECSLIVQDSTANTQPE